MIGAYRSVKDWWQLAGQIDRYRKDFMSLWKKDNLDAILCPTMPYVAPPTGTVKYLIGRMFEGVSSYLLWYGVHLVFHLFE
jgi:Asp-tRNA(Asn)/Glu-tRNA(Gln) amidotransferase A subunit family amidase